MSGLQTNRGVLITAFSREPIKDICHASGTSKGTLISGTSGIWHQVDQIYLQSGYNIKLPPPLIIHKVLVSFFGEVKTSETSGYTHSFHEVTASWTDEFHITHWVTQKHERHSGFLWLWVVLFQSWARQWITDKWVRTLILCGARSEEYPRAQRWALKYQIGEHGEGRRQK